MKISPNSKCPCNSGQKYKSCCQIYHNGAKAPTALLLMRSRYSAYAICNANYIIKTTHQNNLDHKQDKTKWKDEILSFCLNTNFLGLKIVEFIDGKHEAYVTFEASLSSGTLNEKSRFLKENGSWLYESGEFLD